LSSETLQRLEFVARAFDYPLKFHYEVAINRIVACMEGLNRLSPQATRIRSSAISFCSVVMRVL
jgi:hypothetical protein